jgi:hypothetical protein
MNLAHQLDGNQACNYSSAADRIRYGVAPLSASSSGMSNFANFVRAVANFVVSSANRAKRVFAGAI